MTYSEKLATAPGRSVHELDPAKAKRLGGQTMLIPSVEDVRAAIAAIPFGETRSLRDVRTRLAEDAHADVTCPFIANRYWQWLAFAVEEENAPTVPWWRVLKDGKCNPRMPGGIEGHAERLRSEGSLLKMNVA